MSKDFLGNPLFVGDIVVCLVYNRTSADFRKGAITKLNDKTAMVKMKTLNERRFDYSKIIKTPSDLIRPVRCGECVKRNKLECPISEAYTLDVHPFCGTAYKTPRPVDYYCADGERRQSE